MPDISKLKEEYDDLTNQLTNPELISQWEKFQEISKKRSSLEKIIKKVEELNTIQARLEENRELVASQEEPELAAIAEQELVELKEKERLIHKEIEKLLSKESSGPEAIIMEIRAGTGGDEASLFAKDLLEMYTKYAISKGWKVILLSQSDTEVGGIREVSFEVSGEEAYDALRFEGGVHRVQRIPDTERQGRIHTSTISIAVLPKPKKEQITLNPADLKIETTTSTGPGGQNVNKRQTAVRVTYIPTGLMVVSQISRNQRTNRENAIALIQARILEQERLAKEKELAEKRNVQIGGAERAEKIRTYNYPQDRITDHRIKESWYGIDRLVGQGELDPIVEDLQQKLTEKQ